MSRPPDVVAQADRDLLLGGHIRVRLQSAGHAQLAAAARQFGIEPGPPSGEARLTVRYVDRIPGTMRLIGLNAGRTSDRFIMLHGGKRASLPFDAIGEPGFTIDCERTIDLPPHLVPLVNVLALASGILPLHASAAVLGGQGIAFAGWSKGGKTEALLAAIEAGGDPVADEWLFVDPGTREITTMHQPIRLEDAHLGQLPRYRSEVRPVKRAAIGVASVVGRRYESLASSHSANRLALRWAHRFAPLVDARRHADLPASRVLGSAHGREIVRLDRAIMIGSGTERRISVQPIDRHRVIARMAMAHQHHRTHLLDAYRMFRFAFPDRPSPVMEALEKRETTLLDASLPEGGSDCIEHPYPVPIGELRDVLARLIDRIPA